MTLFKPDFMQCRNFLLLISLLTAAFMQAQEGAREAVRQRTEVYFDFGKHALQPSADSVLMNLITRLGEPGLFHITITAHTDSIGTPENNLALSQRRADAVKNFLVKQGLPADKITLSFLGETQPASDNGDEMGRQRNRRAVVEFEKILQKPAHEPAMAVIEGRIVDQKTGAPLVADIILRTKETRDSLRTDANGYFKKTYPPGTVAGIDVFAACYFLKTEMVKATPDLKPLLIELQRAAAGEKMDIENLYFVGGQAVLLETSKPELPKILRFMQSSPGLIIEIAGHVNFPNRPAVVEESAEYKLSVARAKMVHDYLFANGISAERIRYKGYGNWEMRFPKAIIESEQAQNRRVEIRVLENACK